MQYTNFTINEHGLNEIKEFLAENHRLGGDHFTREMLLAWAADAEQSLADGCSEAMIELKSWDSIHGRTQTFSVSEAGIDKQVVDIDE